MTGDSFASLPTPLACVSLGDRGANAVTRGNVRDNVIVPPPPLSPDSASGTQSTPLSSLYKTRLIRAERVAKRCPTVSGGGMYPLSISRAITREKKEEKEDHFHPNTVFGDRSYKEVGEVTVSTASEVNRIGRSLSRCLISRVDKGESRSKHC